MPARNDLTIRWERLSCLTPENISPIFCCLYAPLILQLVEKVTQMGLAIRTICPDHGIIWRTGPGQNH